MVIAGAGRPGQRAEIHRDVVGPDGHLLAQAERVEVALFEDSYMTGSLVEAGGLKRVISFSLTV